MNNQIYKRLHNKGLQLCYKIDKVVNSTQKMNRDFKEDKLGKLYCLDKFNH